MQAGISCNMKYEMGAVRCSVKKPHKRWLIVTRWEKGRRSQYRNQPFLNKGGITL